MIFKALRLVLFATLACCSIGVCVATEANAVDGSPKLPSTVVFSEKPPEKVFYDVGPNQTLIASVTVPINQMSRPEVAKAVGRAISKKLFIAGLRRLYGLGPHDELVVEGLSPSGRESFESGIYYSNYSVPLSGVRKGISEKSQPAPPSPKLGSPASSQGASVARGISNNPSAATTNLSSTGKVPNWSVDPKVLEFGKSGALSSALMTAGERLNHEFECCSVGLQGILSVTQVTAESFEALVSDVKTLTESCKAKVSGELSFTKQEKVLFAKRIDELAEPAFQSIIDLIK